MKTPDKIKSRIWLLIGIPLGAWLSVSFSSYALAMVREQSRGLSTSYTFDAIFFKTLFILAASLPCLVIAACIARSKRIALPRIQDTKRKSRTMQIAVTLGGVILGVLVLRFFFVHQVDPIQLETLDETLGAREVEAILGKPTSIVTNDSFWTSWRYDRVGGVYCEVVLSFDNRGKYRGRFHDH